MNTNTDYKLRFSGLTSVDAVEMDSNLMKKYGLDEQPEHSLSSAIQALDPVEVAPLYVGNPYDPEGEPIPISFSNATINPDTAIELARRSLSGEELTEEDGDYMAYATHSDGYAAVPHFDFFFPLAKALLDADIRNVAGEFRVYDNGAQVHGEVMFQDPDSQLHLEGDRDPLFVGLSVGNSYDGSCSMYAMGYAMDTFCKNSMRNLTERKSRKHIGEPTEVAEWWEDVLTQMTALRDILGEIIEEALEVEIDFLNQPYDVEDFYQYLGLPGYLARAAATSARNRSPMEGGTRTAMNFWTLHSGLTSALTHDFNGTSEIGSIETYSRIAVELLFNPQRMIGEVKAAYEREQRKNAEVSEREIARNLAQIEQYEITLEDRKEEFEQFEEFMDSLLTAN
ncbi:hypothetical protein ACFQGT_09800 [Natrialbaceae archaeon GCM10025810]|uniref:hypothetical protein n=1 Tax=Halovalidus salilacus TaxID=3075124 RepID=UPI00361DBAF8